MLNTFTSRDTWGILKLSEQIYNLPQHMANDSNHFKKHKERSFEKALFVTHEDIFNFYADEHIDDYVSETSS